MPAKPAPCPHCAVTMRHVAARARSGYALLLDQCPTCGGVWCDRFELYPLDAGEAHRVDPLDSDRLLRGDQPPSGPGRCPRCTAPLRPFTDPALPPATDIERCAVCDGMWFNRGSLARAKPLDDDAARRSQRVTALTQALGTAATWPQVDNLDAATYAADQAPEAPPDWGEWLRTYGPWAALATLVRILLR